jgi:acyl-CoA synthetase (AMP-forming)/AMP-acid ligase II/acyl carrier protein
LHGGKCVLAPAHTPSLQELGALIKQHDITTLWLTASLFNAVIDDVPETLSTVRQLLIGGEALSVDHVRRALAVLPNTQIINGYGPTESTTFACCYQIPRQIEANLTSIPIGRPISNTTVYILDRHLSPVPIGVTGELYIGGDGVARGYLNRPELTAEKFIPDPFSSHPGARLYRTGDLARYLPDGVIEFLGRLDHQVKIRGYRIELGEIETVLCTHPGVHATVVLAREDHPGNKQLVAYVVANRDIPLTSAELRAFLRRTLPEYMLPSAFVFLGSLPLTPNGKIDRKALPASQQSRLGFTEEFVAPGTPLEEIIAAVWREVLRVERVGIHDNFFELGGHSLLATQVVVRVTNTLQTDLSLRDLFAAPTVSMLAQRLQLRREKRTVNQGTKVTRVAREQYRVRYTK